MFQQKLVQGGFPKMSYFGVKKIILGHFGPKKVDFGNFEAILKPFLATFEHFRVFFYCKTTLYSFSLPVRLAK